MRGLWLPDEDIRLLVLCTIRYALGRCFGVVDDHIVGDTCRMVRTYRKVFTAKGLRAVANEIAQTRVDRGGKLGDPRHVAEWDQLEKWLRDEAVRWEKAGYAV